MLIANLCLKRGHLIVALMGSVVALGGPGWRTAVEASNIARAEAAFWDDLYDELHPGERPRWAELGWYDGWAQREKDKFECVVVEILQGRRDGIPWQHGLFAAKRVQTKAICDAVYARMTALLAQQRDARAPLSEPDRSLLIELASVLAGTHDNRAVDPLNGIICDLEDSTYSHIIAHRCLVALRKIGNAESLKALREMPARKSNKRIDRMAAMTEKIIEARLKGVSVSPKAQKELRELAERFVHAARTQEYTKYVKCFPFGFQDVTDEGDMREFLDNPDGPPSLDAIMRALDTGKEFNVDLENLRATLACGDRYELECVLEVDGWKVANVRPFGNAE